MCITTYASLFHASNHFSMAFNRSRLVSDSIKAVDGVFQIQWIISKIHNIYSFTPKMQQLSDVARNLNVHLKRIGNVFDNVFGNVRWVLLSYRVILMFVDWLFSPGKAFLWIIWRTKNQIEWKSDVWWNSFQAHKLILCKILHWSKTA